MRYSGREQAALREQQLKRPAKRSDRFPALAEMFHTGASLTLRQPAVLLKVAP